LRLAIANADKINLGLHRKRPLLMVVVYANVYAADVMIL
jgi:hypothetical protein